MRPDVTDIAGLLLCLAGAVLLAIWLEEAIPPERATIEGLGGPLPAMRTPASKVARPAAPAIEIAPARKR